MLMIIAIEIVLSLRLIDIWIAGELWNSDQVWIWPTFMLCYEVLSEINPFLIFCWVLFKQVLYYSRQIKKNQGYEYIDKKFAL